MSGRLTVALLIAAVLGVGLAVWLLVPRAGEMGGGSLISRSAPSTAPSFALPGSESPPAETRTLEAPVPTPTQLEEGSASLASLEITVRHAHGPPAANAKLVVALGKVVHASAVLDGDGRASFEPVGEPVDLWIGGATLVPEMHSLALGSGAHEITLKAGEIVSGVVRVDGAPPRLAVPVSLNRLSGRPKVEKPDMPGTVSSQLRTYLAATGSGMLGEAQFTDGAGRFLFSGVPRGWTGELQVPRAYHLRDDPWNSRLIVTAPAVDVLLDLVSFPAVRGRVLAAETFAPVAAHIDYHWMGENNLGEGGSLDAGDDGRFEMPLRVGTLKVLELTITDAASGGRAELERTHIPAEGADLGDIVLETTRDLEIVVVDAHGAPVQDAIVVTVDPETKKRDGQRTDKSDAQGRCTLEDFPLAAATIEAWAYHYEPAALELAAQEVGPVSIVLQPATSLDIHVALPEGLTDEGLWVRVSADESVFQGSDMFQPPEVASKVSMAGAGGGTTIRISQVEGRQVVAGTCLIGIGSDGWAHLPPVNPGISFRVAVADSSGFVAWGPEEVVLQRGERREIHVVIARVPADVEVLVVDGLGAPVKEAELSLSDAAGDSAESRWGSSDAEGRARFTYVWSELVDLTAEKEGYAIARLDDVTIVPGGAPIELVLHAGREVSVCVRDELGRPVQGGWLTARADGQAVGQVEGARTLAARPSGATPATLDADCFTLVGLPEGEVTLVYSSAGRSFEQRHDTAQPSAEIVVPRTGALVARWPRVEEPLDTLSLLVTPHGTAPGLSPFYQQVRPTSATEASLPLFPGEYDVKLTGQRGFTEWPVLSAPVTVSIAAGATVEVVLDR